MEDPYLRRYQKLMKESELISGVRTLSHGEALCALAEDGGREALARLAELRWVEISYGVMVLMKGVNRGGCLE